MRINISLSLCSGLQELPLVRQYHGEFFRKTFISLQELFFPDVSCDGHDDGGHDALIWAKALMMERLQLALLQVPVPLLLWLSLAE
jgi:hypothetical protein